MNNAAIKPHYTATELAALNVPGFPTTKRRIYEKAKRENWPFIEVKGVGGTTTKFLRQGLPNTLQHYLTQPTQKKRFEKAQKKALKSQAKSDAITTAKVFFVREVQWLGENTNCSREFAIKTVLKGMADGSLTTPAFIDDVFDKLPAAKTLRDWCKKYRDGGRAALEPIKNGPKNKHVMDRNPAMRMATVSYVSASAFHKVPEIREMLIAEGFDEVPSERHLGQWIADWKSDPRIANGLLYKQDPDRFKSERQTAQGSKSSHLNRINQLWEIDGTLADIMCQTADGTSVRYSLTALIDVFSRRVKILVSRQPSSVAVCELLGKAILDWGLPEVLKADNGKDYASEQINRYSQDMGFSVDYSKPYTPEDKPHIERFFGTLTRKLFPYIKGFCGHNVNDANQLRAAYSMAQRHQGARAVAEVSEMLTGGELQIVIDEWIELIYEARPHRGLMGKTPFQRSFDGGEAIRIEDHTIVNLMAAPVPGQHGIRKVGKKGIQVDGHTFIAEELGALPGHYVHVKYHLTDPAKILVYTGDRKDFICEAVDPTMSDVDQQLIAKRAKRAQRVESTAVVKEMNAANEAFPADNIAGAILTHKAKNEGKGKVVRFPGASDDDAPENPAFVRERKAAAAMSPQPPSPQPIITEEIRENAQREFAIIDARNAEPEVEWLNRADGSQRPYFEDDFKFIGWMQQQPEIHPEDVTDLRDYLTNGTGRIDSVQKLRMEQRGVDKFVTQLFKDMDL